MTFHQLRCFTTLTQTLHYTEAANLLYLSQPSLSYAISTLEDELGVKLFEKHGKVISMTKFAKEFLPFAQTAINSLDAGKARLKEMLNPKNLRLGYIYSLSYDFLPSMLAMLPSLDIEENYTISFFQGQANELVRKIQDDELDFAFTPFSEAKGISSLPIFTQEIFLIVPSSHPLANREVVSLEDVRNEKFAMIRSDTNLRHVIDSAMSDRAFKPNIVFEGEECHSIATYVASDFGIALLPKPPALQGFKLSCLKISDLSLTREIFLLWKADRGLDPIVHKIHEGVLSHLENFSF